jgi:uncharacterized protein (DUF1778 family)
MLMPVNASKSAKDRRINFRATSVQESLIRAAADKRGISMTDFVLESACTRAEETIADQVHFVLSPKQWRAFTDALERPARVKPRLRKLLTEPSVLESAQTAGRGVKRMRSSADRAAPGGSVVRELLQGR